jgi:hypothetical protein
MQAALQQATAAAASQQAAARGQGRTAAIFCRAWVLASWETPAMGSKMCRRVSMRSAAPT